MTRRGIIEVEPDGECSSCGLVRELRPYGYAGALVCFECGMKDEEECGRRFMARVREEPDA